MSNGTAMEKLLAKVDAAKEELKKLTDDACSLNESKKEKEAKLEDCEKKIEENMQELKNLLRHSSNNGTEGLSKSILRKISKLLEERQELVYLIDKYEYHHSLVQNKASLLQEKMRDSSDIYFCQR